MRLHPETPDLVLALMRPARARVLAGVLLGLVVGLGFQAARPPVYRSTVAVELGEVAPAVDISATAGKPDLLSVDTDAQIVRSDAVVRAVAGALGRQPWQVRTRLAVGARQLTRVLEITYADGSASAATIGARTAAEAFLAQRHRLAVVPARAYLEQISEGTDDPVQAPDAADADATDLSEAEARRERALRLELALPAAGRVLQDASAAPGPERPDAAVPVASGAALGGLLALGSAVVAPPRGSSARLRRRAGAAAARLRQALGVQRPLRLRLPLGLGGRRRGARS